MSTTSTEEDSPDYECHISINDNVWNKCKARRRLSEGESYPLRTNRLVAKRLGRSSSGSGNIIDDRSNSASPTRLQPHPLAMYSFHPLTALGTTHDERIREWPPQEPRSLFSRRMQQMPRAANSNLLFYWPTATVNHVNFVTQPDNAHPPPVSLSDSSTSLLQRTSSSLSLGSTPHENTSPLNTASVSRQPEYRMSEAVATVVTEPQATDTAVISSTLRSMGLPEEAVAVSMRLAAQFLSRETLGNEALDISVDYTTLESRVPAETDNADRLTNPAPRRVFFIVMDTNGRENEEDNSLTYTAADLMVTLQSLRNQLNSETEIEER